MGERSDRAPLLDWEEVQSAEKSTGADSSDRLSSPSNNSGLSGSSASGLGWSGGPDGCGTPPATSITQKGADGTLRPDALVHPPDSGPGDMPLEDRIVTWEEKDQIVSVFVVTFNTRTGNMLEWCLPKDMDLEGVEFKAIASGSHRVTTDFIYFRKGSYFGLACFANMPVESTAERGARMKSVGILSPSYTLLYRYMSFLEHQVRLQLQFPGHYSPLEAFYEDKRALLLPSGNDVISVCPINAWGAAINHSMHPEMKITHPAGCMSQFIRFFGEQIMVLWKLALLRRRILIFSPPPVGVVCYRVYCCCCLANISIPGVGVAVPEFRPFFYVNVADISALENELSYVACTTEKIFEEKRDLYDIYVDNQNVKTYKEGLKPLLRISNADREKYRKLTEQRKMLLYSQEENGDCVSSEEDLFILFFLEQNNRIFQTLSEVAGSPDPTLTAESVRAMGLDPHGDRLFLLHLLEIYGFDTLLVSDQLCCS
ncbi:DENN domain-containing protein 11-like [Phyllopteryx taeniolatus]|uniref:DENN domain-containing protein 11-like n=1 Tax=Phyllopteryx taeniolatus TaxID=161469 RepID=UPI002AD378E1|nr:DENN domain-containing protein 11-like [Phyllopteryx taeniolatus]XP_061617453.1 DENN domain-containing protein 11-like [Phyllopteryx taeniolatus]XP_061617454.1 DENN domain-containing protein 11-like [Phyllopteryx taeniolatus]